MYLQIYILYYIKLFCIYSLITLSNSMYTLHDGRPDEYKLFVINPQR